MRFHLDNMNVILCALLPLLTIANAQPRAPYTAAEFRIPGEGIIDDLIRHYYGIGYTAQQIILILAMCHNAIVSLRHLRRLIRRLRVRRMDVRPRDEDVVNAIRSELRGAGQNIGYRAMCRRLRTRYNLVVTQDNVRQYLSALDPEGVERRCYRRLHRRRYVCRGPNHVVHVDGYDKLKQFGFAVHAAVDGFSRKVLWLRVGFTNNDPRYVAGFYLDFVRTIGGVPCILRCDRGTENSLLRDLHIALRWNHDDTFCRERSFMYGRSTSNQRVESWWGQLGRLSARFWSGFFKDLRDTGEFDNSNPIHVEAIRFCFTGLIQRDLDMNVQEWNQHNIRAQSNDRSCYGIPDLMYYVPELYGREDCKKPLSYSLQDIDNVSRTFCLEYPTFGCREEFVNAISAHVGDVNNFALPDNIDDALGLYETLKDILA